CLGILPIPDVTEIRLDLTREEEAVRWRKCGDRCALSFRNQDAVPGLQPYAVLVADSAEAILLGFVGGVPPSNARRQIRRESVETGVVLISDRGFVGLRNRFHPQQSRAGIDGEAQVPRKDSHGHAGEGDLKSCTIGFQPAASSVVGCRRAPYLLRLARQARIPRVAFAWRGGAGARRCARHQQWRIPEHLPLLALYQFGRDFLVQFLRQRRELLIGDAADAAGNLKFRHQIARKGSPCSILGAHGQLANEWLTVLNGEDRTCRSAGLPPSDGKRFALHCRSWPDPRLVIRQIADDRLGMEDETRTDQEIKKAACKPCA